MAGEQVDFDGQLVAFAEDLRAEGVAVGTSELLDAFAALELVDWSSPARVPRDARDDDRQVP